MVDARHVKRRKVIENFSSHFGVHFCMANTLNPLVLFHNASSVVFVLQSKFVEHWLSSSAHSRSSKDPLEKKQMAGLDSVERLARNMSKETRGNRQALPLLPDNLILNSQKIGLQSSQPLRH